MEETKVTTCSMCTDVNVKNAYGIYIDITGKAAELMAWAAKAEAEHFAEIAVKINGEEREFTLIEFMELLGFKENKGE